MIMLNCTLKEFKRGVELADLMAQLRHVVHKHPKSEETCDHPDCATVRALESSNPEGNYNK